MSLGGGKLVEEEVVVQCWEAAVLERAVAAGAALAVASLRSERRTRGERGVVQERGGGVRFG
jgi:hypothetical protein